MIRTCHDTAGRAEGERRRDSAHALLGDRRAVYVRRGQRALLTAMLAVGTGTADDIRAAVDLPPDIDPVCVGPMPIALARAGIIYRDGYTPTCRPTAHARPVSVWRLADPQSATRWLADHPDLPDPVDVDQRDAMQGVLFPIDPRKRTGRNGCYRCPRRMRFTGEV